MRAQFASILLLVTSALATGCAGPQFSQKAYSQERTSRQYEYEMKDVWKALEKVVEKKRVLERDPKTVEIAEWGRLPERTMKLDWVNSQSRDKYKTFTVNGLPRQQPLQVRYQLEVTAKRVMGATEVAVRVQEELEDLDDRGLSKGYVPVDPIDTTRAAELLDQIGTALLSASARPLNP